MDVSYRMARQDEAGTIAELYLQSSDGLAEYIWGQLADDYPGRSPLEIGERRYAREGVPFSYQNAIVAEAGGRVVGMAASFPMHEDPDAAPTEDPVLRPYAELEDYGSLYIPGMAVFEDFRGRGLGRELLRRTAARASGMGLGRLSLIVFERNPGAHRLYLREGFRETGRRPLVPHPLLHIKDGDAILMVKEVG